MLKDFLNLRPVFHWTEKRVRGHIGLCVRKQLAGDEEPGAGKEDIVLGLRLSLSSSWTVDWLRHGFL